MLHIPKLKRSPKAPYSIGVLTSGGDAPGMNAAVRAVVRYGMAQNCQIFGIYKGYTGLIENQIAPLNLSSVANIIQHGGTVLKTSRCPEWHKKSTRKRAAEILGSHGIQALVVIGGDGSFTGAHHFEKETKFPTIGVPGTIDNDIFGSDDTIGFDTAVNTALASIDRIRDTANSHERIFIVEVMGRAAGIIANHVGIAGGAETIIVPEEPYSIEQLCETINRGIDRGKASSIIVAAEGPSGDLAAQVTEKLLKKGFDPKVCILGHTQRGGSPTAHDRYLGSTMGASAIQYLLAGKSGGMVGVQKDEIVFVPYSKIIGHKKQLAPGSLELAGTLAK